MRNGRRGGVEYRIAGAVLLVVLLSAGCSLEPFRAKVRKPTVTLVETGLSSVSFDRANLILTVAIDNPNPLPLRLTGFEYRLWVADQLLFSGVEEDRVVIGAATRSVMKVPITLHFTRLGAVSQSLRGQESLSYRVETSAAIVLPLAGTVRFPASAEGRVPIPRLPRIRLVGGRVDALTLSRAALRLVVEVANPNSFDVNIRRLSYQLSVNGAQWAQGQLPEDLNLSEKTYRRIEIPVTLDFLQAGEGVYRSLRGAGDMQYRLSGSVSLDSSTVPLPALPAAFSFEGVLDLQ